MPAEDAVPALGGCGQGERTLPVEDALLSARWGVLQRTCVATVMSQEAAVVKALGITELFCIGPVGRQRCFIMPVYSGCPVDVSLAVKAFSASRVGQSWQARTTPASRTLSGMAPVGLVLPWSQVPSLWGEGEQALKGLVAKVSVDCNRYRNDEWHEWTITPATANKPCHMESGVFQGNQLSLRAASAKWAS